MINDVFEVSFKVRSDILIDILLIVPESVEAMGARPKRLDSEPTEARPQGQ